MSEVEFEENSVEIKRYLRTVRECKDCITQIPAVLNKLLSLLNTSTALLEDLCSFDTAPAGLQQRCVRSRQQMLSCYEGSALQTLTASIQDVVHERLVRMEQLSQHSHSACKRRRESRAKYLSDTNAKGPFNLSAPSSEKLQRHRKEFTESDEAYRQACEGFAKYRYAEMGTVQRDFYAGYSGVFALLANALLVPEVTSPETDVSCDEASASSRSVDTRLRLRARRDDSAAAAPVPAQSPSMPDSASVDASANTPPPATQPAAAAAPAPPSQRRLSESDGWPEKPVAVSGGARGGSWRQASSMPPGEVVQGIPVLRAYSSSAHTYISSQAPPPAAAASGASDREAASANVTDATEVNGVGGGGGGGGDKRMPVHARRSSNSTLNHYGSVSLRGSSLQREYSLLKDLEDF